MLPAVSRIVPPAPTNPCLDRGEASRDKPNICAFPPLFWSGRKPGNESSGEGIPQVGAASFIPVLLSCSGPSASLEHPMDKTPQRSDKKAPQPQIFPLSRGLRLFPALPPHAWDANAGSELSVLPPDVGASPEPLAGLGQRPAHPAPINSRCPDKILLSSGPFSPAGTRPSGASEGSKGSKQSRECSALARFPAESSGEVWALPGSARGRRDRSHPREWVALNPSCAGTSHPSPSSPWGHRGERCRRVLPGVPKPLWGHNSWSCSPHG